MLPSNGPGSFGGIESGWHLTTCAHLFGLDVDRHPSHPRVEAVKGTISKSLDLLAKGMTPFVIDRLRNSFGPDWQRRSSIAQSISSSEPEAWDAHVVLVLMWEHWNAVFRHDLTYVERCLVSELRESRNRWAHQQEFTERDTYRCLDSVERLLSSIDSPAAQTVDELRRESLQRLHDDDLLETNRTVRDLFTAGVTAVCGVILAIAVVIFFPIGFSGALAVLIVLVFGRLVWRMVQPTIVITTGPRQCSECARVFYGGGCPYCEQMHSSAPRKSPEPLDSASTDAVSSVRESAVV